MKLFKKTTTAVRIPLRLLVLVLLMLSCSVPAMAEGGGETAAESGQSWNERYAVSLYGIRHDDYRDSAGKKAGLTFGPATGTKYLDGACAHVERADYARDPSANCCLHWMSWEEIAEQSLKDPTVFQPCLEYGCTHSVDIVLNDTLLYKDYSAGLTGDGATILDELKQEYTRWCSRNGCPGGWPASRVRAVLNGADEYSDPLSVGEEYLLSPQECIFAGFPAELQARIVPKTVVSDLNFDGDTADPVTTYDRLWLFSAYEVYGIGSSVEGTPYERNVLLRDKRATFGNGYLMYSEKGNEAWAWFRSMSDRVEVYTCHIFGGGGHTTGSGNYKYYALTPGFCLP